jgi:hypothetical protein
MAISPWLIEIGDTPTGERIRANHNAAALNIRLTIRSGSQQFSARIIPVGRQIGTQMIEPQRAGVEQRNATR